ncbi:GH16 beta-1,3-glucan recognition protein [Crucibulum laeve]|uniref:GH16 beta-1,3-glucan recognition protein n=1 Tax=Crucibulum laeve TaxID=68775 RepID=A0A5C3M159_9AGAR|nr:GH16 beta-1,3-glucan recognition protein [Crucibulum laeve]
MPPQRPSEVEAESRHASHSRTTSGAVSYDSPPITPRSFTFGNVANPFSPPASVASFSSPDHTPIGTPAIHSHQSQPHYPFPDVTPRSGITSMSTSVADLSRSSSSYFGSRPGTADYAGSARPSSARIREAFASPKTRPLTMYSAAQPAAARVQRERPKSTMLTSTSSLHKPWMTERDPYSRLAYFLTYGVMLLGVAAGVIRCYTGWQDVPLLGNLCLVMDENFDTDEGVFGDNGKFFREVDMSGFGNGEFEMTTASTNNSFVRDGYLYIAPTLTSDNIGADAIVDGYVYNITGCTFNITQGLSYTSSSTQTANASAIGMDQEFDAAGYYKACSAVSNSTAGQIINPVQSARISTRRSANIKFGRVEVRAKIPNGDWLWPAIWMLPVDNTYGAWPLSGELLSLVFLWLGGPDAPREIDIMEARGNGPRYPKQGNNWVRGSLNWGPSPWLNAVAKTFGAWEMRRGSYSADFHTYALEWDEDFMRLYVDTRLHHLLDLRMKKQSFWERGDFPAVIQNGSEAVILNNPWVNGTKAAPFDQSFYLIMNVAVGGTNGWFPDGDEKPWLDGSTTAMSDFWRTKDKWLPSWPSKVEDRAMVVDHVKMWQKC